MMKMPGFGLKREGTKTLRISSKRQGAAGKDQKKSKPEKGMLIVGSPGFLAIRFAFLRPCGEVS